jgi:hypothetical protein
MALQTIIDHDLPARKLEEVLKEILATPNFNKSLQKDAVVPLDLFLWWQESSKQQQASQPKGAVKNKQPAPSQALDPAQIALSTFLNELSIELGQLGSGKETGEALSMQLMTFAKKQSLEEWRVYDGFKTEIQSPSFLTDYATPHKTLEKSKKILEHALKKIGEHILQTANPTKLQEKQTTFVNSYNALQERILEMDTLKQQHLTARQSKRKFVLKLRIEKLQIDNSPQATLLVPDTVTSALGKPLVGDTKDFDGWLEDVLNALLNQGHANSHFIDTWDYQKTKLMWNNLQQNFLKALKTEWSSVDEHKKDTWETVLKIRAEKMATSASRHKYIVYANDCNKMFKAFLGLLLGDESVLNDGFAEISKGFYPLFMETSFFDKVVKRTLATGMDGDTRSFFLGVEMNLRQTDKEALNKNNLWLRGVDVCLQDCKTLQDKNGNAFTSPEELLKEQIPLAVRVKSYPFDEIGLADASAQ